LYTDQLEFSLQPWIGRPELNYAGPAGRRTRTVYSLALVAGIVELLMRGFIRSSNVGAPGG
jgi:hypothetical protein